MVEPLYMARLQVEKRLFPARHFGSPTWDESTLSQEIHLAQENESHHGNRLKDWRNC
jgi:hypothetical protein